MLCDHLVVHGVLRMKAAAVRLGARHRARAQSRSRTVEAAVPLHACYIPYYHGSMQIDMKAFIRAGAEARLAELAAEMNAIRTAFPNLGGAPAKKRGRPAATNGATRTKPQISAKEETAATRKRKPMSAAAKQAVGERMKAYWQKRKGTASAPATEAALAPASTAKPAGVKPTAKRTLSPEARARISAAVKKRWKAHRKAKKVA